MLKRGALDLLQHRRPVGDLNDHPAGKLTNKWMAILNERIDQAVATLDREKMASELMFRAADGNGEI
jgi:Family of unknown function (DUF6176)